MLCPLCHTRGGKMLTNDTPIEHWQCDNCQAEYAVYRGYPIHPEAFAALTDGHTRCPVCGDNYTEPVYDAPDMGTTRVFRCHECDTLFPALVLVPDDIGPDGLLLSDQSEHYLPVHPQAMIDTVTNVEHLPSFFALTQRLREYIEHTGFTVARTEDRVDMDTQVREFTLFFIPDAWVADFPERSGAVQGALTFSWHAGLSQYAGTPASVVNAPVPLALGLSVLINPQMVARSLQAYLHVIAGISNVLAELELADDSVIESEVAVAPSTQEATIQRLAAVRRFTLDLASPDQWTALIMAMPQQQVLLTQIWELLAK